jgi:hypothetical protein
LGIGLALGAEGPIFRELGYRDLAETALAAGVVCVSDGTRWQHDRNPALVAPQQVPVLLAAAPCALLQTHGVIAVTTFPYRGHDHGLVLAEHVKPICICQHDVDGLFERLALGFHPPIVLAMHLQALGDHGIFGLLASLDRLGVEFHLLPDPRPPKGNVKCSVCLRRRKRKRKRERERERERKTIKKEKEKRERERKVRMVRIPRRVETEEGGGGWRQRLP